MTREMRRGRALRPSKARETTVVEETMGSDSSNLEARLGVETPVHWHYYDNVIILVGEDSEGRRG